jgi:type II secretion system protein G
MKQAFRAFTLIELLVVLAVIGIITSLVFVYYPATREDARNTARISDIKEIQAALELYRLNEGHYPASLTPEQALTGSTSSTTYMKFIPSDPQPQNIGACSTSTEGYAYSLINAGHDYSIDFCISKTTGGVSAGQKCATAQGIRDGSCCDTLLIQYEGGPYNSKGELEEGGGYYRSATIAGKCWMTNNLDIGTRIDDTAEQADADAGAFEKYCYNDSDANCVSYGGLYQWHTVMALAYGCNDATDCTSQIANNHQGICPSGWHIPTDSEWHALELAYASPADEVNCSGDRSAWGCGPAGTELGAGGSSNFECLWVGLRMPGGTFANLTNSAYYYSSSATYDAEESGALLIKFYRSGAPTILRADTNGYPGFSARCVRN